MRKPPVVLILLLGFLIGCRGAPAPLSAIATATRQPSTTPFISPTPTTTPIPSPTATLSPTATPTATPSPTPTATPSPTPTPVPISLLIPTAWQQSVTAALAGLPDNARWQLQVADEPQPETAVPVADVVLHAGRDGILIAERPLVLAVPFTTNWEAVSRAEADQIIQEGHPLVELLEWPEMAPTHKALRVDGRHPTDPDYPFHISWSLVAAPGYEAAAQELAAALRSEPEAEVVHLAAVGDVMLSRGIGFMLEERGQLEYPFAYVAPLLQAADVTVANLESALGDVGEPAVKSYTFRAPPQGAEALALAGIDVVSLANNHAMDYGPEALLQGIELLRAQNVAPIGAGPDETAAHAPALMTVNGLRLAFLGYVHVPVEGTGFDTATWTVGPAQPGLAWAVPERIQTDVIAARSVADLVIVLLHSGYEYIEEPSEPQVAAARAAIDAGAALVIGHHAHILQGIEFYNGGVIAYGLGNFVFAIEGDPTTAILNVWLDRDGVRQLELVPAVIQFGGQPRLAESWEAAPIRSRVYFLTQLLNAR